MNTKPPSTGLERFNSWIRNSITIRLIAVTILVLLLLIPTAMIKDLIRERQYTHEDAMGEVSSKWSNSQTITGLVLTVPYSKIVKITGNDGNSEVVKTTEYAHFLPDDLTITGNLQPEKRYRGIYEVIVYSSELSFSGNFPHPDFTDWKIPEDDILWEKAFISLGISDLRGIQEDIKITWNNTPVSFNPGIESNDVIATGISSRILLDSVGSVYNFKFKLTLNGSNYLYFIPVGKETNIEITGNWPHPKFDGEFLPDSRDMSDSVFSAQWKIFHLNRDFPQQWKGADYLLSRSSFGVDLYIPVDEYQKSMRSAKYAVMLICLTFLVFFFVEIINKKRIHPIQYLLVGLALILFFTLLLSISEHINFNLAYIIASVCTIGLVFLYSKTIFRNKLLTNIMGLILIILYGFIFTILQLQDYALLIGSIGLFVVLAVVMYISRKIEWYKNEK